MSNEVAIKLGCLHPNGTVNWPSLRQRMLEWTPALICEQSMRQDPDVIVTVDGAVPKHRMGTGLCEWSWTSNFGGLGGRWGVTYRSGKTSEPGNWTNNDAEMSAMFEALLRYTEPIGNTGMYPFNDKKILICSDSKFIVQLVTGRIRSAKFQIAADEARDILLRNRNITVKWIPSELNAVADALSRGLLPLK